MAPVAVALWRAGAVPFNPDALLMAVAAGASLGIVIPTHQATIVVMNSMDFSRKSFIKTGAAIAAIAGSSSAFVIYTIWC
jgi:di/tricarboxylate transporter